MESQSNSTLVRRYYEEALSHGDWAALDQIVSADFVEHERVPNVPPTVGGLKQKYDLLRGGFTDLTFTVEEVFARADRVAVSVTVSGTHTGLFMGRPPSGRTFAAASVSIFRIGNGRIVEHWGVFDQIAMLAQLGAF